MTVVSLQRSRDSTSPPRRRRSRIILARLGGGLAVLVPIVLISTFISYSLGALSNSDPAATILGQDAATPAAVARLNRLGLNTR
jgi:peptide/nickel transport system permease protein